MTTLLTGATGFVGAAVLRSLIAAGHNVRALIRPNSDRRNLASVDCEIAIGDLAEPDSLKCAVQGCEAIFHVAADYRIWVPDHEKMNRVNIQGTVDLIRAAAAAGVSRIVYTSSVATLRLRDDGLPSDEESHAQAVRHDRSLQAVEVPGRTRGKTLGGRRGDPGGHCAALGTLRTR